MYVLGIELRLSGLAASALTDWAISLALTGLFSLWVIHLGKVYCCAIRILWKFCSEDVKFYSQKPSAYVPKHVSNLLWKQSSICIQIQMTVPQPQRIIHVPLKLPLFFGWFISQQKKIWIPFSRRSLLVLSPDVTCFTSILNKCLSKEMPYGIYGNIWFLKVV